MTETPPTTRVELQERSARPYIWLDVSYNGKHPPTELFADLEMVGWTPPAPGPPPRSAIDWDTPNTETGDPFTIGDYRVDDTVQAPAGSGDRGRWTPAERAVYLRSLDGVLRRHGLGEAPLPAPPPPSTSAPVASEAASVPETGLVHLDALLVPGVRQLVLQVMSSLDLPARVETREFTKTVQFRGSATTAHETGLVLSSVLAASEITRVTAILVNAKAVADEDAIIVSAVEADELASFVATPADPATAARSVSSTTEGPRPASTTLVITMRSSAFGLLRSAIEEVGATVTGRANTKITTHVNHRGSTRTMTTAGVRVTIDVEREHVEAVLDAARECGVDIDDSEAVSRVERPSHPPS